LIIMDGGSTDGSVEILKRYDSQIKYWETKPDRGIYHAWNKALAHSGGEWICFIGSDDFFVDEGVLFRVAPCLVEAFEKHCLYAYGQVELYSDRHGVVVEKANDEWASMKNMMKYGGFLVHSGSFHHKSLFDDGKRFNEKYKICGDKDFMFRVLKVFDAYYINNVIIRMSMGGLSYNLNVKKEMVKETLAIWRDIPMPGIPWILYFSLVKIKIYAFLKSLLGDSASLVIADASRRLRGKNPYWNQ
jgi:glycosyltransferase involved in cell wall biosynthesis